MMFLLVGYRRMRHFATVSRRVMEERRKKKSLKVATILGNYSETISSISKAYAIPTSLSLSSLLLSLSWSSLSVWLLLSLTQMMCRQRNVFKYFKSLSELSYQIKWTLFKCWNKKIKWNFCLVQKVLGIGKNAGWPFTASW